MGRKYDWRRVRIHFSYEIPQAAQTLNCSVSTIRNWIKSGLPVIADQKPHLVDGHDLRAFARRKSEAQKWVRPDTNTPWNYFACFRCKAYRKPILLMVDYIQSGPGKGRLTSICEVCEAGIAKFCKAHQLPQYSATLHVTHQPGANTLSDPDTP